MKLTLGVRTGMTIAWAAAAIYRPTIAWTFTRIPPATPEGWAPRYRTWDHGVMTEGEW